MLAAQIMSALTVSLCLLIDNIMIGRYLGERALTAYGLANPVLLFICAIGSMLCAGVQVACSKSLGRGDQEETNVGYSSAVAASLVFSVAMMVPTLAFSVPISRMLGAKEALLLSDTSRYMAGFAIGMPATVAALVLVPFLQMAGKNGLLIAAVLGMTVTDVAFDFLNVLVFHGGMFGMGLASSLSYYVAIFICVGYFLSKKCAFTFSLDRVRRRKIKELFAGGVPSVVGMASTVAMVLAVNHILMGTGGAAAVAAYSVINTLINASNCISAGSGSVALTLSGVLDSEEDRTGLSDLLRTMLPTAVVLGLAVMSLLLLFARPCVELFIPFAGESQTMAIRGVRMFAMGLAVCCWNSTLKNCYQGTGRVGVMEIISVVDNAVFPILTTLLFCRVAGVNGAWFYFLASETLTALGILGWVWIKKKRVTSRAEDILMLREGFGVPPENLMEANPRTLEEVMAFSREAEEFCHAHGGSAHLAIQLALCVEEMGSNIVVHGFRPGGKNSLSLRLQYKEGSWTLRFRDDCVAFDPLHHIEKAPAQDNVGIRLVMRISDEARYVYTLNLNNLTLVLKEAAQPK